MTDRLDGFARISDPLQHMRDSGSMWPSMRLPWGTDKLVIKLTGPSAQHPVSLKVGSGFDAPYLGAISAEGRLVPGRWMSSLEQASKRELWGILCDLRDDPFEALAKAGKALGSCALCGRALSDRTSVEIGIGPICRAKAGFA